MKCTNKYKILLPVLILALLLLTGCTQRSDVAEAYQLYETSDNYALTGSSASAAPELLAENLCVGGTENSATALMQHSHRVRVYFLWKMR